jgi:hypothetical protein
VDHTPLGAVATITGGDVYLATFLDGVPTLVTGHFTGAPSVSCRDSPAAPTSNMP